MKTNHTLNASGINFRREGCGALSPPGLISRRSFKEGFGEKQRQRHRFKPIQALSCECCLIHSCALYFYPSLLPGVPIPRPPNSAVHPFDHTPAQTTPPRNLDSYALINLTGDSSRTWRPLRRPPQVPRTVVGERAAFACASGIVAMC
jgi:hypothetical protein